MLSVLTPVSEIVVGAMPEFRVRDVFPSSGRKVMEGVISLGPDFLLWFGNKIEKPKGESRVRWQKVNRYTPDTEIVSELGGEANATTAFSELVFFLRRQAASRQGPLLTEGDTHNLFLIPDVHMEPRIVKVGLLGGGWWLSARQFGGSSGARWGKSVQFFSPCGMVGA